MALGHNNGIRDTRYRNRGTSAVRFSRFIEDDGSSFHQQPLVSCRTEVCSFVKNNGLWLGQERSLLGSRLRLPESGTDNLIFKSDCQGSPDTGVNAFCEGETS